MESIKSVSNELKKYFASNSFFKVLLPFDMIFAFGGVGIMVLNIFVATGGLVSAIAYYAFILGVLLAFANKNHKYLYFSMFAYAGISGFTFLKYAFFQSYRFISYYDLITCAIFGFIAYRTYINSFVE